MIRYLEAIEQLPVEIKLPLMKAFELFKEEIAETVKRSDFEELKAVVRELAEAQKKTEQRVEELVEVQKRTEQKVEELAEAQRETQKEVSRLDKALSELAEAQKKTEERLTSFEKTTEENFKRVWASINELAEAQKKTEERLTSFEKTTEENFKRVWASINELAEAQKKTEEELKWLIKSHKDLKEEVGYISHTVGYRLEDESYKALPGLLKKDMGITIIGRLKRDFIEIGKERYIEVNIWGSARSNGKRYVVIGEAKSQLKKKDIDEFIKKAEAVKKYVPEEQIRVLVTYHTSPQVMRYASEKKIKLYFSYDF